MYICVCNAITEKDIENIIDNKRPYGNISSVKRCMGLMGKQLKCGKCEKAFEDKIRNYYDKKNPI